MKKKYFIKNYIFQNEMKSSKWMNGGPPTLGQLGSLILLSCLTTVLSQTSNYIIPTQCTDDHIKKAQFDYIHKNVHLKYNINYDPNV